MSSLLDKITGRLKKTAGDLTDNEALRKQGRREERKGEAKEELDRDLARASDRAHEVESLERKT